MVERITENEEMLAKSTRVTRYSETGNGGITQGIGANRDHRVPDSGN